MACNENEDFTDVADTQPKKKRKRAANFAHVEDEALISGVERHKDLINAAFCGTVTFSKKRNAWKTITDGVNAVGGEGREVAKVKKRWEDLKRKAKQVDAYERSVVETLGLPQYDLLQYGPPDLHRERIVAIAGRTTMQGIPTMQVIAGGVDSDI